MIRENASRRGAKMEIYATSGTRVASGEFSMLNVQFGNLAITSSPIEMKIKIFTPKQSFTASMNPSSDANVVRDRMNVITSNLSNTRLVNRRKFLNVDDGTTRCFTSGVENTRELMKK